MKTKRSVVKRKRVRKYHCVMSGRLMALIDKRIMELALKRRAA